MNFIFETVKAMLHRNLTVIFLWMVRLLSVVGTAAVGIALYGAYFEAPLIRYQNLPFPVENAVEQGRTVPIIVERCNDTSEELVYFSSRQLRSVDSDRNIILPNATISMRPGCHRNTSRSITIPRDTPVGQYVIEGDAVVSGLVKQHRISWYTEKFNVTPISVASEKLREENAIERMTERNK